MKVLVIGFSAVAALAGAAFVTVEQGEAKRTGVYVDATNLGKIAALAEMCDLSLGVTAPLRIALAGAWDTFTTARDRAEAENRIDIDGNVLLGMMMLPGSPACRLIERRLQDVLAKPFVVVDR